MECWSDARISGPNTPLLHHSNTPAPSWLFTSEIFEVDPPPNFRRDAVARGESCERGFGRGVHAPLPGIAIFFGRRVEVRAARVADNGNVAIRLATRRDRPIDLPIVEDVDVVIDDDDSLHI